jgi:hypothetical protein
MTRTGTIRSGGVHKQGLGAQRSNREVGGVYLRHQQDRCQVHRSGLSPLEWQMSQYQPEHGANTVRMCKPLGSVHAHAHLDRLVPVIDGTRDGILV